MGLVATKPVFRVPDKVRFKPACSATDWLEKLNFAGSKLRYGTFQTANNKGTDQTALMRRLVCACVVRKYPEDRFSRIEAQMQYID